MPASIRSIFVQQSGTNKHEHICNSLELFAATMLPEFKARDAVRQKQKQVELAPFIEQALARKPRMKPIDPANVPVVDRLAGEVAAPTRQGRSISRPTAVAQSPFRQPIRA